jgi:hypothetical protein
MVGNVIEESSSDYKYVEVFTDCHDGSTGSPSRRIVFVRTNLKTAGKNMKTNMLQGEVKDLRPRCT